MARRVSARTLATSAVLALCGCQTGIIAPRERADAELTTLLRYGNAVREFDAAQLEREYRMLVERAATSDDPATRIQLALLISSPDGAFHDYDHATQLLEGLTGGGSLDGSSTAALGRLLYNLLRERSCVVEPNRPLAEMLIAERDRNRQLDEELRDLRTSLQAEREHRETLETQLEGLKALEERLSVSDGARR